MKTDQSEKRLKTIAMGRVFSADQRLIYFHDKPKYIATLFHDISAIYPHLWSSFESACLSFLLLAKIVDYYILLQPGVALSFVKTHTLNKIMLTIVITV